MEFKNGEVEQNIPPDMVAPKDDAKVLPADARQAGSIDKFLADPKGRQAAHFVISKGLILKKRIAIPTQWGSLFAEDEFHLPVDSRVLTKIFPYQGE